MTNRFPPDNPYPRKTPAGVFLFLLFLVLVGAYLFVHSFGIYEDDYFFTIQGYGWDWPDCWAHIKDALLAWHQGRPVGFALTHLFSWLTAHADSLLPAYGLGALILFANAAFLFQILKNLLPPLSALVAAGVYCLYPVDASRMILMHRAFLLLNFTFLLVAFHSYLQGRRTLSYFAAVLSLLTYESFFFPFLLAPLLLRHPREVRWERLLIHLAVCFGLVTAVLLARNALGDTRIGETLGSSREVIEHMIKAMGIGPWTALKESFLRLLEALYYSDSLQWVLILGTIAGVILLDLPTARSHRATAVAKAAGVPSFQNYSWLALVGLLMLAAGYLLAFRSDNYPPVVTIGRLSGFNAAGAFGAAVFFGSLFALLESIRINPRVPQLLAGLLLGCLVSFGVELQRTDYVRSWELQKQFWLPLLATSGEWSPGVPVIVNVDGQAGTPGFPAFWPVNSAPMLASYVCQYPDKWLHLDAGPDTRLPRVYGYYDGVKSTVVDAQRLMLNAPPWSNDTLWPVLRDGHFVYFGYTKGELQRIDTPVILDGHRLLPKRTPDTIPPALSPTKLYKILFGKPPTWPTFRRAHSNPS